MSATSTSNPDESTESMSDADRLVGAVIFESLVAKFEGPLDEEGAFEVLSDFTSAQLLAFTQAVAAMPADIAKLHLVFPESSLDNSGIEPRFLSPMSAVEVRNEVEREGRVVITAEVETDAAASRRQWTH